MTPKSDLQVIIDDINNNWPDMTLTRRLDNICALGFSNIIFTTSFGLEDQYLTYVLSDHGLPASIITLDTGRMFDETYQVWQLTQEKYAIEIVPFFPSSHGLQRLMRQQGVNGFRQSVANRRACCYVRKILPLGLALAPADAWLTGLRGQQSSYRRSMNFAEYDKDHQVIKLNPLLDFKRDDIEGQIAINEIPYNQLHDMGFISIGCAPCTRAVRVGEDERAGRWWWENNDRECGLHVHADKPEAMTSR